MTPKKYGVVVIGGGHAGVEAAWAAAKFNIPTLLITQSIDHIGYMSCNPAIGGLAKSHLVKEMDILGGVMPHIADKTAIQFKMLNRSKGPAVWALRVQSDKTRYAELTRKTIQDHPSIDIIQDEVLDIKTIHGECTGVLTALRGSIKTSNIVLCAGTFLNGKIHIGKTIISSGRLGERASNQLADTLFSYGFERGVLKTGTPPRISKSSIDFSVMDKQGSDENFFPFSIKSTGAYLPPADCYMTHTNQKTHQILRENIHLTALYSGQISGTGPRYCPSIEDKITRFADKESHRLFIEPEGLTTDEYYINGFSTSLPLATQIEAMQTVRGLEKAHFVRPAYAIEYDYYPAYQLKPSLETKKISGLFFAGQINGTSGYEEAAAQGLIAGINAAKRELNQEPIILKRDEAYIGILIDDLITKDIREPYRMFTSLAEYRLQLRHDNADSRLLKFSIENKLLDENLIEEISNRLNKIDKLTQHFKDKTLKKDNLNAILTAKNVPCGTEGTRLATFLKKPDISIEEIIPYLEFGEEDHFSDYEYKQAETIIKYEGYINREQDAIKRAQKSENQPLSAELDYKTIKGLRNEAIEKFNRIKPITIGQAGRIAGISPADITILIINLKKMEQI